jgi:S-methylmethionine-dependent homocysteine/selenocysteine methylase
VNLPEIIRAHPVILTEGALIERLRRDATVPLDPDVLHAGFIYDERGREALRHLYRQYLDIGSAADLPMIVCTPTWRANPIRLERAGLMDRDVNGEGARFLASIRGEYGPYAGRVCVGGLMGCMGDAYKPKEGLSADEAARFHGVQARALAAPGVDFLLAATLPNAEEARGMAVAMADCEIPYVLSFVVKRDGQLLDGTPLHEAVVTIDEAVSPRPLFYMVNCVHPTVCEEAFASEASRAHRITDRVIGLQANASAKSPEELEGRRHLDADPPEVLADAIFRLRRRFGTRILGGCCGTDHRHIEWIARRAKDCTRPIL